MFFTGSHALTATTDKNNIFFYDTMKRILFFTTMLVAGIASAFAQGYSVRGTVNAGFDGKNIYLATYNKGKWIKNDSAVIKDNKFTFDGKVEVPDISYLLYEEGEKTMCSDFVLENSVIALNVTIGEGLELMAMGTKANDAFSQYKEALARYREKARPIQERIENSSDKVLRDSLVAELYSLGDDVEAQLETICVANKGNFTGLYLAQNFYTRWQPARAKQFLAEMPQDLRTLKIYRDMESHLLQIEMTAEGKPFVDIKASTPEGKELRLSDFVGNGKVVLVDFWASWCRPCMMEMPNVVKAYELFKSKGLEIVGVSLDNKSEAWKKALAEQKMTWPQMSDLKGWDSEVAKAYAVKGIPATVLIDKEGKIAARDLRGTDLLRKIEELLK